MNNYKFGDGGFEFINYIIENIKLAWKTYLILGLLSAMPAVLSLIIQGSGFIFGAFSQSIGVVLLSSIISIVIFIATAILSLVFSAGLIKCANETDIESGYYPNAAQCINFGFSKLGKLIIFSLLIILITIVVGIALALVVLLGTLLTLGLGLIVIVPALIVIVIGGEVLVLTAMVNIVLKDMEIIESLTTAFYTLKDGFKENCIFILKLTLITIVVGIVAGIFSWIPVVGVVISTVASTLISVINYICITNRFFKISY